ncbi:MAG: sugar transferase [Pseudomonadota bacterium]
MGWDFFVPSKLTTVEPKTDFTTGKSPRAWDYRLQRSEIFMSAEDVQMTDMITSANFGRQHPRRARTRRTGFYRRFAKRILDVALVVLSLPVILPVIIVLALLVARNGGTPFYRQKRIGLNGKIFSMWKLRTMVHNADEVLEDCLDKDPALRTEWNCKQKLLDDPRITPLGRFLRKSSVDELPQLFNVLRGDMSLVGPRPMMVSQKSLYHGQDYYELRPGITGFWQISDRNKTSFSDRAFYDARYNNQLSFRTDLRTLMSTVRVVLCGTGH